MKEEKQYTEGISVKENKFLVWLDNYWYHYKWATLVVAFFVIVFAVCIVQSCTNRSSDIIFTYAGPVSLKSDEKIGLEGVFSKNLPDDMKENGETAGLVAYYILSKEQVEQAEKETDADGYRVDVDNAFNSNELDSFESQLMTGMSSVLLLDPWLYDSLVGAEGNTEQLQELSHVLGATPEHAVGKYGIRLGDTEMYRSNALLQCLPEDTVICLRSQILGKKDKEYAKEKEAFKSIVKLAETETDVED